MQEQHARFLAAGTNFVENVFGSENKIVYEIDKGEPIFMVHILVDGRKGRFPQKIGPILQPTVMILAWQLFLFFVLSPRRALGLLLINMVIFIGIQVFFLLQLTGYHTSEIQKFLYEFLKSSFYVIALVFVIKDNLFHPVFRLKSRW